MNAGGGTGFAGYDDWRIPNVRALQSIVDYRRPDASAVWNTYFGQGTVDAVSFSHTKVGSLHVRAARGGL